MVSPVAGSKVFIHVRVCRSPATWISYGREHSAYLPFVIERTGSPLHTIENIDNVKGHRSTQNGESLLGVTCVYFKALAGKRSL